MASASYGSAANKVFNIPEIVQLIFETIVPVDVDDRRMSYEDISQCRLIKRTFASIGLTKLWADAHASQFKRLPRDLRQVFANNATSLTIEADEHKKPTPHAGVNVCRDLSWPRLKKLEMKTAWVEDRRSQSLDVPSFFQANLKNFIIPISPPTVLLKHVSEGSPFLERLTIYLDSFPNHITSFLTDLTRLRFLLIQCMALEYLGENILRFVAKQPSLRMFGIRSYNERYPILRVQHGALEKIIGEDDSAYRQLDRLIINQRTLPTFFNTIATQLLTLKVLNVKLSDQDVDIHAALSRLRSLESLTLRFASSCAHFSKTKFVLLGSLTLLKQIVYESRDSPCYPGEHLDNETFIEVTSRMTRLERVELDVPCFVTERAFDNLGRSSPRLRYVHLRGQFNFHQPEVALKVIMPDLDYLELRPGFGRQHITRYVPYQERHSCDPLVDSIVTISLENLTRIMPKLFRLHIDSGLQDLFEIEYKISEAIMSRGQGFPEY